VRIPLNVAFLSAFAVLFFSSHHAFGQQVASAGVYGSVLDAQGAVIVGAKVTLVHVSTGQGRTAVTNGTGEFVFPLLAVGEYRVARGPNFKNTDMSVSRAFPLPFREGMKVWFRTEFFNLFNRPQLSLPNGTIGNRTFGRITSTTSNPRILQLSLKVEP
jgi:hypothetical protein